MGDDELTSALFDPLYASRTELEQVLGLELSWERLDGRRASRVAIYHDEFDLNDTNEAEQAAFWTVDQLAKLHGQLDRRLRALAKETRTQTPEPTTAGDAATATSTHRARIVSPE